MKSTAIFRAAEKVCYDRQIAVSIASYAELSCHLRTRSFPFDRHAPSQVCPSVLCCRGYASTRQAPPNALSICNRLVLRRNGFSAMSLSSIAEKANRKCRICQRRTSGPPQQFNANISWLGCRRWRGAIQGPLVWSMANFCHRSPLIAGSGLNQIGEVNSSDIPWPCYKPINVSKIT
jgi:hypothetical protein